MQTKHLAIEAAIKEWHTGAVKEMSLPQFMFEAGVNYYKEYLQHMDALMRKYENNMERIGGTYEIRGCVTTSLPDGTARTEDLKPVIVEVKA